MFYPEMTEDFSRLELSSPLAVAALGGSGIWHL